MNNMYEQLVASYYNYQDCENYWHVFGSDKIVVASVNDMYCDIYDDAKSCFEHGIKENLEMLCEPEELDICFDEEELGFIKDNYPDSVITEMIELLEKERE